MKRNKNISISEMHNLERIVFEKTGYRIKNRNLLVQAFTLNIYSARHGGEDNALLAFIGNRILEYYVVKIIAERYGYIKTQKNYSFEGDCEYVVMGQTGNFMNLKKNIINNTVLAQRIDEWKLVPYMIVGKYGISNQDEQREKTKASLFEAILGAVAIASQWNQEVLQNAVEKMLQLESFLEESDRHRYRPESMSADNAVDTLKKLAEQGQCSVPIYKYGAPKELGYDEAGNPKWVCTCTVNEWALKKQVWASSKELAEKYAAYLILCEHFELCNEYRKNGAWVAWKYENGRLIPNNTCRL